jgi:hypothetical protein
LLFTFTPLCPCNFPYFFQMLPRLFYCNAACRFARFIERC